MYNLIICSIYIDIIVSGSHPPVFATVIATAIYDTLFHSGS